MAAMKRRVRKAVIPVAGLGTRFLPATKAMPKEMLTVVDRPLIQYVVEEAVQSGIEDILIVTGRTKRAIEDHFDRNVELEEHLRRLGRTRELAMLEETNQLARIMFVRQKEPLGLGDAILAAERYVAPTILTGVRPGMAVMQEEIFGPLLPVVTWRDPADAVAVVGALDKPLMLYVFTQDRAA